MVRMRWTVGARTFFYSMLGFGFLSLPRVLLAIVFLSFLFFFPFLSLCYSRGNLFYDLLSKDYW